MMRDGVCDDTSNIAKCLYDGGDCCQENKDRALCRDCTCVLKVDQEEFKDDFKTLRIQPVEDQEYLKTAVGNSWTIEVDDVVSGEVCAVLCLEHEKKNELNAWSYQMNEKKCKCGWIESTSCPEKFVTNNWTLERISEYSAFIQLEKTVSCGESNIY